VSDIRVALAAAFRRELIRVAGERGEDPGAFIAKCVERGYAALQPAAPALKPPSDLQEVPRRRPANTKQASHSGFLE
jgi:hypothetical protein